MSRLGSRDHPGHRSPPSAAIRILIYQTSNFAAVEKNGAVVRRMVGYRRYAGIGAASKLACLYRSMRLFVNFFQPSFKLMEKTRDGPQVTKRYHAPLTPFQRVQAHPAVSQAGKDELAAQFAQLNPVVLLGLVARSLRGIHIAGPAA